MQHRTLLGSAESRRLRKRGFVPGVIYGQSEPIAISIGERELRAALTTASGAHAVLDVAIDGGGSHSAILKDFQRNKVRGEITHVDLQEVRLDVPIQTALAVTLVGEAHGVREGGDLTQVTNDVNIEVLPLGVPEVLEADVSGLGIGDSLRLSDIPVPAGVTWLDDPTTIVLATVSAPSRETEEVAGDEGASAEAEASGDAAADEASAESDSADSPEE